LAYSTSSPSNKLDPTLGFITIPILAGFVLLRQSGQILQQLSQFSESLLQGEQLPILERRSSGHNESKAEALLYRNALPVDAPIDS
jgi:hypothetical protein